MEHHNGGKRTVDGPAKTVLEGGAVEKNLEPNGPKCQDMEWANIKLGTKSDLNQTRLAQIAAQLLFTTCHSLFSTGFRPIYNLTSNTRNAPQLGLLLGRVDWRLTRGNPHLGF